MTWFLINLAAGVTTAAVFASIALSINARARAIRWDARHAWLGAQRADRLTEDLHWMWARDAEAARALELTLQRAIREHPARVAALVNGATDELAKPLTLREVS